MELPRPTPSYDANDQARTREQIKSADRLNMKSNQDIDLVTQRLYLHSPDGAKWQIVVDNAGALSASPA